MTYLYLYLYLYLLLYVVVVVMLVYVIVHATCNCTCATRPPVRRIWGFLGTLNQILKNKTLAFVKGVKGNVLYAYLYLQQSRLLDLKCETAVGPKVREYRSTDLSLPCLRLSLP